MLLLKFVHDLKGACTCTYHLRSIVCKLTWLVTFVSHIIKSFPVLTWDQSCAFFCSFFLLSKGVPHALFVLSFFSIPCNFHKVTISGFPKSRLLLLSKGPMMMWSWQDTHTCTGCLCPSVASTRNYTSFGWQSKGKTLPSSHQYGPDIPYITPGLQLL